MITWLEAQQILNLSDDQEERVTAQIAQVAEIIERYLGRRLTTAPHTHRYPAEQTRTIFLTHYPLVSIESLTLDGVGFSNYYIFNGEIGEIEFRENVTGRLVVDYTAGYDIADVPQDLKGAACAYLGWYRAKLEQGFAVSSASLEGTWNASYDNKMPMEVKAILDRHKGVNI